MLRFPFCQLACCLTAVLAACHYRCCLRDQQPSIPTPPFFRTFYRLYTVEAGVLLLMRWMFYRWSRQHYYLFDW